MATTYRLLEATDGEQGVVTALETKPDIILMDVQLRNLSGLDATRQLRQHPTTARIPIIVVTSFALSGDEQKAQPGLTLGSTPSFVEPSYVGYPIDFRPSIEKNSTPGLSVGWGSRLSSVGDTIRSLVGEP